MDTSIPFKWRHFEAEIILLCVRWYLRYSLSYRDLEEMMLERGLQVDHTTIYRWVQCYAPELEKRCSPQRIQFLKRVRLKSRWPSQLLRPIPPPLRQLPASSMSIRMRPIPKPLSSLKP